MTTEEKTKLDTLARDINNPWAYYNYRNSLQPQPEPGLWFSNPEFYKYETQYYEISDRVTREDNWTISDLLKRLESCMDKYFRLREIIEFERENLEIKYENNMISDIKRDIEQLKKFEETISEDMLGCAREQREYREELIDRVNEDDERPTTEELIKDIYLKILNEEDINNLKCLDDRICSISDGLYGYLQQFFEVDDYNNKSFIYYIESELNYARQDLEKLTGIPYNEWEYNEDESDNRIDRVDTINLELSNLKDIMEDFNQEFLDKIRNIYSDYLDRFNYCEYIDLLEFVYLILEETK